MTTEELNEAIAHLGRAQPDAGLYEDAVDEDPFVQFASWLDQALHAGIELPNSTALATATKDARPSVRMVLLKSFDSSGFVFYTNYESRKGRELAENPRAALVFHWKSLHRQVCITGTVERVSEQESDEYFASRPFGSRLGAWASRQSEKVEGRPVLDEQLSRLEEHYRDGDVPRPPYWGGYRLRPDEIEFWQGRPNRIHDRLRYRRARDGTWVIERLAP